MPDTDQPNAEEAIWGLYLAGKTTADAVREELKRLGWQHFEIVAWLQAADRKKVENEQIGT